MVSPRGSVVPLSAWSAGGVVSWWGGQLVGWSAADQPGDGLGGLADLLVGLRAAALGRLDHAVGEVLLEQLEGEGLQRLGGSRDLGEDVDAVLVLLDHPLQAADLALDTAQALEVAVLARGVAVRRGRLGHLVLLLTR